MLTRLLFAIALLVTVTSHADALTVYPVHRATILAGAKFDFKVEFDRVLKPGEAKVTINGADYALTLGRTATFVEKEPDVDKSALILRDVVLTQPGYYRVVAHDGKEFTQVVTWEVFAAERPRTAKNVILFVGDGLSVAHRTAARILSKGIAEGKYHGDLAMDTMPRMALVGTSGVDSVITDSANSAAAYATGHKSSVNALGVYADRTKDTLDDPKVETISSLVKRKLNMAVGVVTNTEVEDATPAAMVAHTRRRSDYDEIVKQFYGSGVDVLMGGGSANFLPQIHARLAPQGQRGLHRQVPAGRVYPGHQRSGDAGRGGQPWHPEASRPLPHRKYGRRPRSQVPQEGNGEQVPRSAGPRRPDEGGH